MAGSRKRLPRQMRKSSHSPAWNDPSPMLKMTYASYAGKATVHAKKPSRDKRATVVQTAVSPRQATPRQSQQRPSPQGGKRGKGRTSPLLVIVIVALASAAVMAFGNPLLWIDLSHGDNNALFATSNKSNATVIGEYQTASQSDVANRAVNLDLAAQAIDGQTIESGATFSFNDVVGDTAESEGYLPAPAIVNGSLATERGGGVCQVASTLYVAALHAGLQIEERHPHTLVCDYAPLGLDATVAYGAKDLVIRNTGNTPVQISAFAQGQTVYVSIAGRPLTGDVTYDAYSLVADTTRIGASEAAEKFGAKVLEEGTFATAYTVETYLVKNVKGVEQETTLLSSDTYLATEAADAAQADAAGSDATSQTSGVDGSGNAADR